MAVAAALGLVTLFAFWRGSVRAAPVLGAATPH
jgi:hypothetical protein